jgi:hypothetical protein
MLGQILAGQYPDPHRANALQKISIYVFPEKEFRGSSPNFHIHVSVSDLYIPIGLPLSCSRIGRPIAGIYKSLTET